MGDASPARCSSTADGRLEIDATSVEPIDEPEDPYEY